MSEIKLINMLNPGVKRFFSIGGMISVDEGVGYGLYVQSIDYDVLAAQLNELKDARNELVENNDMLHDQLADLRSERDEGLAREAELFDALDECDGDRHRLRDKVNALQQRLAEADKLLRSLDSSWNDHGGRARHSKTMNEVEDYLASPGCADGEE